MERSCGTVKAMAEYVSRKSRFGGGVGSLSPEMFLTKICMVSAVSGDTDRDIEVDERILSIERGL